MSWTPVPRPAICTIQKASKAPAIRRKGKLSLILSCVSHYPPSSSTPSVAVLFSRRGIGTSRGLSYVGRMEETEHDAESDTACTHCHELRIADLNKPIRCRVYTDEARAKYHTVGGKRCARCIFDNKRCSLDDSTIPLPPKKAKPVYHHGIDEPSSERLA